MIRVLRPRNRHGSLTALAAAFAFALVILGVGFFFFVLFMDAQKETKNAVDAGALNVGKRSLDKITVEVLPTESQRCFWDVVKDPPDNSLPGLSHPMNLRRINRVWAEALLMKLNAVAAGAQVGSGHSSADQALSGAQDISNRLANELKKETNLHGFFTELAQQNNIRMIGNSASVKEIAGANWQTSKMNEGSESNVTLPGSNGNNFAAPPGSPPWSTDDYTVTQRVNPPPSASGKFFLKGYVPINIGGNTYWQVPFLYDEKPHMVSKSNFEKAQNKAAGWSNAVPNSFSAEGVASQPGKPSEKATSWCLTNPRQIYKAAIPHSFVRIKVDQPFCNWNFFPTGGPPEWNFNDSDYNFTPDNGSSLPCPGGGPFCITVQATNVLLGQDVVGRSLDELIFGYPYGSTSGLEKELVARCNEMTTEVGYTVTASDVHSALSNGLCTTALATGLTKEFFLYCTNGKKLACEPLVKAVPTAPWLGLIATKTPEGIEKKVIDKSGPGLGFFIPMFQPQLLCGPVPPTPFGLIFWNKEIFWKPGTGFNGCLGEVRVRRSTDADSHVICAPLI